MTTPRFVTALLALCLLVGTAAAAGKITPGMISCETYAVRDLFGAGKLTPETFPAFCKAHGITGVCFNDFFLRSWDEGYLAGIKNAVAKAGCVVTGVIRDGDLAGVPDADLPKVVEECKMKLRGAAYLGAPAMRINVGGTGDEQRDATEGVQKVAKVFNELLPLARQLKVKLTIENHGGVSRSAENILAIIKATDPEWVGSCLDFGNWPDEVRYESCRKLAPHAFVTHAKLRVFDAQGEDPNIDGCRILAILRHAGYKGALSIEFEGPGDQEVGVIRSRDLLLRYWPAGSSGDTWSEIMPKGARVEKVAGGFQFTEGPVWAPMTIALDGRGASRNQGALFFTDVRTNEVWSWDGKPRRILSGSRGANGLAFAGQGLLACRGGAGDLARIAPNGMVTPLVSEYQGRRFNSPNDLALGPGGAVYFTDPIFGGTRVQPVEGVYRLAADGQVALLVSDMAKPNGVAISRSGIKLYVADSAQAKVRAYDLDEQGKAGAGYDFATGIAGTPDGMALDCRGNLYVAAGGGVWVFDADGNRLGVIKTPEEPTNCAFGGTDGKTLFITARTSVYRIRLGIAGMPQAS